MSHFNRATKRGVQPEPHRHLQKHLEAAADRVDALAAVDGHDFLVHLRLARIAHRIFLVFLLNGFDFRRHALHFQRRLVARNPQREQQHIDDQRQYHDRPSPIGDVVMQPLQPVEERLGDEFQPSEINQSVQRWVHLLQVVVIFRSHVNT